MFFTLIFALESLLKSIAYGFFISKDAYLRETWNQLDFFIVVSSLIDMAVASINIPAIKVIFNFLKKNFFWLKKYK